MAHRISGPPLFAATLNNTRFQYERGDTKQERRARSARERVQVSKSGVTGLCSDERSKVVDIDPAVGFKMHLTVIGCH